MFGRRTKSRQSALIPRRDMTQEPRDTRLSSLEKGMDAIRGDVKRIDKTLTNIETEQYKTNQSLNNLESGQRSLETSQLESSQRSLRVANAALRLANAGLRVANADNPRN